MTATRGVRGWFVTQFWWNTDPDALGPDLVNEGFYEPWDTDIATFATREETVEYGKKLAALNNMPFVDNP